MTPVETAILKALAWHALFGFPLTVEEVRVAAPLKMTLEEAVAGLASLRIAGRVGERRGFFFLAGREADVAERLARYDVAEFKFRRARRFVAVARFLPFVRAVFACNTLARSGAAATSDIDLAIIAAPSHVWTSRLFVTGLATLLHLRPLPQRLADTLCLSFYADESALDFEPFRLPDDESLPRWIADFYPLYDESNIASRIFEANSWILKVLPNALPPRAIPRRSCLPLLLPLKRLVELLTSWLEPLARRFQEVIMPTALKAGGPGVVLTDHVLKLHVTDRRAEQTRRYRGLLKSVIPLS